MNFTPHILGIFYDIYGSAEAMTISRALLISLVGFVTVIALLGILALLIKLMSALFDMAGKKKEAKVPKNNRTENSIPTEPKGTPLPSTQSQGELKLVNVDEPTAAVIMALVSHRSGIPLNRLKFESIKLMEDE